MTDQEYANKVNSLVTELNQVLMKAVSSGIHCEARVTDITTFGDTAQRVYINVKLMRELQ